MTDTEIETKNGSILENMSKEDQAKVDDPTVWHYFNDGELCSPCTSDQNRVLLKKKKLFFRYG